MTKYSLPMLSIIVNKKIFSFGFLKRQNFPKRGLLIWFKKTDKIFLYVFNSKGSIKVIKLQVQIKYFPKAVFVTKAITVRTTVCFRKVLNSRTFGQLILHLLLHMKEEEFT